MTFQPGANLYTQGFGSRPENVEVPVLSQVSPGVGDVNYPIGKRWINEALNAEFTLTSFSSSNGITTANWEVSAGGSFLISTVTTQDLTVVKPTAGNINLSGAGSTTTVGSGSTATVELTGLTNHAVLVGAGTTTITKLTVGTDGQVLTGNSAADPSFDAIGTKSGLTAHGVLLAEGASAFTATSVGTTGQVLIGSSGADPAFGALGVNSGLTGIVLGNTNSAFTTTTFTAATSFVPAFALGTPGDSAWTYSSRVGRYTQIGAVVYFTAQLVWSNFTNSTGSGTWQLNLPVAADAIAFTGHIHISGSGIDANAETANLPANFTGEIGTGATTVILSVEEGGIANAANALFNLTVTQVLTAGTMNVSGWYFAA